VTPRTEKSRPPKSVLIVEDNDDLRDLFGYWLKRDGFDVLMAADGTVALRIIENCTPDLVVLDLHLRTLDGLSVRQDIAANARTCHIPVIVVTGTTVENIAPLNAARVLCKPVDREVLLSAVHAAIDESPPA
jgi:DNA-binding response OmpR family regulator